MKNNIIKIISVIFVLFFCINNSFAAILEKIEIKGNNRVSSETIKLFSKVSLKDNINKEKLNEILKNLYDTNFFEDVNVSFNDNILIINVIENPLRKY